MLIKKLIIFTTLTLIYLTLTAIFHHINFDTCLNSILNKIMVLTLIK